MLRDPNKIFEIENPFPDWLVTYIENQTKDVDWKFSYAKPIVTDVICFNVMSTVAGVS